MIRILVTNDDGINDEGIRKLTGALSSYGEVYVVAPAEEQSGKSHSITVLKDLEVSETAMYGAVRAFSADGTPADCVIWAVDYFRKRDIVFDYLFSGINRGDNCGCAAYYSGTVAAAREGTIRGIKSIAMSVCSPVSAGYDHICSLIPDLMDMSSSLDKGTILSVNSPDLPVWAVKGVRIVEAAPKGYKRDFLFRETEPGKYHIGAEKVEKAVRDPRTDSFSAPDFAYGYGREHADHAMSLKYDIDCVENGYTAISPLLSKVSDEIAFRKLLGLFPEEETVAVFVDAQENVVSGVLSRDRLEDNLGKFARCIARLGLPSVITELYGYGPSLKSVHPDNSRSETIVRREYSAWGSSDFAQTMGRVHTERVLIAGAETHASVLRTALDFISRGYEVTVIEDCCSSRGGHDHKLAIEAMRHAGCSIMTFRTAVTQMLYTTSHPAADAVIKIMND